MRESIYSFMCAQQDETKKLINFDYLNEIIAGVTDDGFDMDMHSTYKFLFYHFNYIRCDLGENL